MYIIYVYNIRIYNIYVIRIYKTVHVPAFLGRVFIILKCARKFRSSFFEKSNFDRAPKK